MGRGRGEVGELNGRSRQREEGKQKHTLCLEWAKIQSPKFKPVQLWKQTIFIWQNKDLPKIVSTIIVLNCVYIKYPYIRTWNLTVLHVKERSYLPPVQRAAASDLWQVGNKMDAASTQHREAVSLKLLEPHITVRNRHTRHCLQERISQLGRHF